MARRKKPQVTEIVYPTVVDIQGMPVRISPFDCNNPNPDNRLGHALPTKGEIHFEPKQQYDQLKNTILHEVLHHIDYSLQLGLKEKKVHRLATVLLQNMRANKDMYRWLMDES